MSSTEKVWIIDFGSQYTQLIARRIRELSVFSTIVPPSIKLQDIERNDVSALVLSGGPASVYEQESPQLKLDISELNQSYGQLSDLIGSGTAEIRLLTKKGNIVIRGM